MNRWFTALTDDDVRNYYAGKVRETKNVNLLRAFLVSGQDIAKVTGITSLTEADSAYTSLGNTVRTAFKGRGLKVSRRGETIYLLNTNINRVVEAPERR